MTDLSHLDMEELDHIHRDLVLYISEEEANRFFDEHIAPRFWPIEGLEEAVLSALAEDGFIPR